jgi:mannose-6-phosphate isomerase-like protein (cupin superfamily)
MPVFQMESDPPEWCELRFFEVVELEPGAKYTFVRHSPKEKLIVGAGSCTVAYALKNAAATVGTNLDLEGGTDSFSVIETHTLTTLIRMAGNWGDEVGGSGLFSVQQSAQPHDSGDPVDYAKETNFDCHYHDCDEYWIIYSGSGSVVSEGKHYQVKRGDCIATGMGHHHDFPLVTEPVKAVYFETTLEGAKRLGHLWDHTHGTAQPKLDRL